jgi:hypothetical protein
MSAALTKGIGFTSVRAFVRERWGEAGFSAVLERLRPDDRDVLLQRPLDRLRRGVRNAL